MPLCCRSFTSHSRSLYFVPLYPLSSSLLFSLILSFPSPSSPLPQPLPWVDKKCVANPHKNIQINHAFAPLATSPQSSSPGDKTGKLCCPSYPPSEVRLAISYSSIKSGLKKAVPTVISTTHRVTVSSRSSSRSRTISPPNTACARPAAPTSKYVLGNPGPADPFLASDLSVHLPTISYCLSCQLPSLCPQ